jgi:hypothetical protein
LHVGVLHGDAQQNQSGAAVSSILFFLAGLDPAKAAAGQ